MPLLQAAHVRDHPHQRPLLGRGARLLQHLLHRHPRPRRPPPHQARQLAHHLGARGPAAAGHPRLLRPARIRPRPRRPARRYPAPTATADQARRDAQTAALNQRLRQIDAAENAHAHEIEVLTHDDQAAPAQAITALRSRILARFTELEDERATISAQLAELAKTAPQASDPALLDNLPLLGDLLRDAPPRLEQQLYAAFDVQALYNKNLHQVTINVTITESTPRAVAAIAAPQ